MTAHTATPKMLCDLRIFVNILYGIWKLSYIDHHHQSDANTISNSAAYVNAKIVFLLFCVCCRRCVCVCACRAILQYIWAQHTRNEYPRAMYTVRLYLCAVAVLHRGQQNQITRLQWNGVLHKWKRDAPSEKRSMSEINSAQLMERTGENERQ